MQVKWQIERRCFRTAMARVLIFYATSEGYTGRVAERIAKRLQDQGHRVESQRADASGMRLDLERYEGVIVGASVHYGRHPGHLRALLRKHRPELAARPGAFFSVSLSAATTPHRARRYGLGRRGPLRRCFRATALAAVNSSGNRRPV